MLTIGIGNHLASESEGAGCGHEVDDGRELGQVGVLQQLGFGDVDSVVRVSCRG
ncbi:MAG: hypothetical protein JWN00_48 [Actinomycetia bacterium]|nr:hypothetical protein [Actinomycetes bacterium]